MRIVEIMLMPWKWEGAVLDGGTSQQFQTWAKTYANITVDIQAEARGHAYVELNKPWLIWLSRGMKDVPTLAHEALHVVSGILEARGLKHTSDSEEAYTYTLEDLLRQALKNKRAKVAR